MTRIIFLVSLVVFVSPAFGSSLANLPGGPAWLSGVGQIDYPDGYQSWKQWMGYDVDIAVAWSNPASSWADFQTGKGDIGANFLGALRNLPPEALIVHAYPMLPNEASNRNCQNPGVWKQFAAGEFDEHYRTMAKNMRSLIQSHGREPSSIILRLGWEMSGDWYAWSVCDNVAEFKRSWERAVNIIRTEMPGMMFDFSPANPYVGFSAGRDYGGNAGVNLEGFLPPDSTYDFISLSHHDARPFVTSEGTWLEHYSPDVKKRIIGLKELVDTAIRHGKKFALSEWGTQMVDCGDDHPAAPNPALFIKKTYDFLSEHKANLAWDAHFSVGCTQLYNRESSEAAIMYKSLWGGNGVDPENTTKPRPPELISAQ